MTPDNLQLRALSAGAAAPTQWYTIGAQYDGPGSLCAADAAPDDPTMSRNDLVVPSDGCHDPGATPAEQLRLGGGDVHHHSYFANSSVRERLQEWLG